MKLQEKTRLNYQIYHMNFWEQVSCFLESFVVFSLLNYLCYRSWWVYFGFPPFFLWFRVVKRKEKCDGRKKLMESHFSDVLQSLHTAVRTGYSVEQGISECRKEMIHIYGEKDLFAQELVQMERQLNLGIPVEQLFLDLGKRTEVEDIRYFGEIFWIAKRSGGNLAEIIEKLAKVLGEKIQVKREIDVSISGKKFEQLIMSFVPGGIILYMGMASPAFLDVLYEGIFGRLVMTGCLILYGFSFWLGRKMIRITI